MPARRRKPEAPEIRRKPATTPEERENEIISMANDLAEEQIRNGSASSQVVTHFLKLGSSRERLEQERLVNENLLTQTKIEALASQQRVEELYMKALDAMRAYSGNPSEEGADDEDPDVR